MDVRASGREYRCSWFTMWFMSLGNVEKWMCHDFWFFCIFVFRILCFFLFLWDNIVYCFVFSFFFCCYFIMHLCLFFFGWQISSGDKGLMLCDDLGIRLKNIIWFNIHFLNTIVWIIGSTIAMELFGHYQSCIQFRNVSAG